jgi:sugar phosphate isomerase/epimerase
MRLGGPVYERYTTPQEWVVVLERSGYRAAYCPVGLEADDVTIQAYREAARKADIVIAEVGAWSNPLSPDEAVRGKALSLITDSLILAEKVGANCCVNISGSRGEKWDGPSPLDLTEETFQLIVNMVQEIIDRVRPTQTCYTLETMPWMYPDSVESYVRLLEAINRPGFAVHFDPVNLVCSPQRYFSNASLMTDFIDQLGAQIKSVHLKDILLGDSLTTHLDEVRPGLGKLDYAALLRALDQLDPDLPVMLEHLPTAEDYRLAGDFMRSVAAQEGIRL